MRAGLVSVMMPAYNAEQYISQAIQSVLDQTYLNWELIIVNDGSTDSTADIVIRYTNPRIKVIHQANGGESTARNTALKHMQGEFVAFLDADDIYLADHLEKTIHYLLAYPHRGGVYTDGFHCDQYGNRLQTLSSRRRGPFEGQIFEEVVYGSDVFGPPVSVVLRRGIIIENELEFDKDITIGPDWVFFTQYSGLVEFGYLDQHTCLYRVHQDNITFRTDSTKRALELAKCRERLVKLNNFNYCSLETRWNVFHDLLVYSLNGFPDRQTEITQWGEFRDLPPDYQAKLFRLMASQAIVNESTSSSIKLYLRRSKELNPSDWRGGLLIRLYNLNPYLCQQLLRFRRGYQTRHVNNPPFFDVGIAPSSE